jgi:beta-N-acetylhexosaminidase
MCQDAGNLFWAGFPGRSVPAALAARLERGALGGVILFARNFDSGEELAALTAELHARWRGTGRLLLGVDQEGGRVARLRTVRWPAAGALGGRGELSLTRAFADAMARELAHFGFNTDFAPVLDVFTNPRNTVIGDRAYGREPETVILHAGAVLDAFAARGILSCGKHFPGHGDTLVDSHEGLAVCDLSAGELESVHERPFRALAGRLELLMTAHVLAPAVDPALPATLSPTWVSRARSLPFPGVLVSDDLEMGAMKPYRDGSTIADGLAVGIFRAGLDMGMICASQDFLEESVERVNAAAGADPSLAVGLARSLARVDLLRRRAAARVPITDPAAWLDETDRLLAQLAGQE